MHINAYIQYIMHINANIWITNINANTRKMHIYAYLCTFQRGVGLCRMYGVSGDLGQSLLLRLAYLACNINAYIRVLRCIVNE